ncbi:MAG: PTS sugar transporter subunit IIA [Chitinispirillales bacterium]|jgi:PTS system fructose-specific IIC component|nr:PTS sugar transporter subunit IIA [Chitinispirillales bacterium]
MIKVRELIKEHCVITDLKAADKLEAIGLMARFVCSIGGLDRAEEVTGKALEREGEMSTGIGFGIAIPHARLSGLDRLYMAAARSAEGIEFDSLDGLPVNLLFMLASPESIPTAHTEVLSALSRILSYEEVRRGLLSADTAEEFAALLAKAEEKYVEAH